ncbi:MAG: ThuA domain-containing protein [Phycisphaeraceae bacterium]|nr:ThuA domain-containing protein [Phycisphaeraceae bacterium]
MRRTPYLLLAATFCLVAATLHMNVHAEPRPTSVNERIAERVEAAIPEKAPAEPKAKRRVLVFYRTAGFRHGSIPVGNHALAKMGEKTGAYEAVVSDDIAMFEPENLAQFDVVIMNNTTGEVFLPSNPTEEDRKREARVKEALLEFVRGGNGLVGIHAATDTLYQWAEYGRMIGAYFTSHPWHTTVPVKVDDSESPLMAMFPKDGFQIHDEIYQFADRRGTGQPYSRSRLRVLMSLDENKMDVSRGGRPDNDYALSWIRQEEMGRVFYTALGHRDEIFWNPQVLAHLLAGIQYAAGDLEADATPSNPPEEPERPHNTLSKEEKEAGWKLLFDGQSTEHWRGFHRQALPDGWQAVDGTLARVARGGDIVTVEQFDHFDLKLDWKVSPRGNSGIFFRVAENHDGQRFGSVWHTGPEYQILDDARHGDGRNRLTSAGSNYAMHAPAHDVVRPAGEWNRARLIVHGDRVEHYLNGRLIVRYDLGSEEWKRLFQASKFRNHAGYGRMPIGHIALQDHGDAVWFRNIKIRKLEAPE